LWFSKKNSGWYNFWKLVGEDVESYAIYKIIIPEKLFTTSFHPRSNKILRITDKNMKEFLKLKMDDKYIYAGAFKTRYAFLKKNNMIGLDLNTKSVVKNLGTMYAEGILLKFDDIKCIKVGFYKNGKYRNI
jgi:hypothetical protein